MASDPLFKSAWLKWAQAVYHAKTLQAHFDTNPVARGDVDPVVATCADYHPKRHGFAITATDVLAVPPEWSLALGDITNNLRAALEHLAWAIVTRGHTPPEALTPKQARFIYFPICKTRAGFNGELSAKLPGARRADIAPVRRYQPYHVGERNRWRHPLVTLNGLNNDDKHKAINPVWVQPTLVQIEVIRRQDCVMDFPRFGRHAGLVVVDVV